MIPKLFFIFLFDFGNYIVFYLIVQNNYGVD
jgi:hypothetical protein